MDTTAERFWAKVDRRSDEECWPWLASLKDTGYGQIYWNGRARPAHRLSYVLNIGPIPEGLVLDHLCRNRACVNPAHLEPVTNEENIRRGLWGITRPKPKTECRNGHPFSPENTRTDPQGWRRCRTCERAQSLAAYHRKKKLK